MCFAPQKPTQHKFNCRLGPARKSEWRIWGEGILSAGCILSGNLKMWQTEWITEEVWKVEMLPHQKLVSVLYLSKCSKCRASGALEKHPICGRTRHCLDIFSCSTLLHCLDITCAAGRPSSPASLSLRTSYRTPYPLYHWEPRIHYLSHSSCHLHLFSPQLDIQSRAPQRYNLPRSALRGVLLGFFSPFLIQDWQEEASLQTVYSHLVTIRTRAR